MESCLPRTTSFLGSDNANNVRSIQQLFIGFVFEKKNQKKTQNTTPQALLIQIRTPTGVLLECNSFLWAHGCEMYVSRAEETIHSCEIRMFSCSHFGSFENFCTEMLIWQPRPHTTHLWALTDLCAAASAAFWPTS